MAGSLVSACAVTGTAGLIFLLPAIKSATKFLGILPPTRALKFSSWHGLHMTPRIRTGLTFGTLSALFSRNKGIIDVRRYAVLVPAAISSAVVPVYVVQRRFLPIPQAGSIRQLE